MEAKTTALIERLAREHHLEASEYEYLLAHRDKESAARLTKHAAQTAQSVYGNEIYIRGLIEFTNHCKNNCYYCGIRSGNKTCKRYRLSTQEIFDCTDRGYDLGFRTFVLQGGEDSYYTDDILCPIVNTIKKRHPDCAVTLSIGERSKTSYERLFNAGADRYLLRHETANPTHYAQLHPKTLSLHKRMECLQALKDIGYATGVGFMVGSPYQTPSHLALDLKFIEEFRPAMCGIGPFVPHHATPFAHKLGGTVALTCFLLSLIRLIQPNILLPATTALGTIDPYGREKGIRSGANVVMPNLSPVAVREKYELYDHKICTGEEAAECFESLDARMRNIGYHVVVDRGDPK